MTAAPAFTVDALLLVERKKGGLRKRLNRNGFGYCMPQVIDDVDNGLDGKREDHIDHDLLGLSEAVNRPSENMKKPSMISFNIFRQSFGDRLIHERLSLPTKDIPKICSNMCVTLKPDSAPHQESAISLSTADNDPGSPDDPHDPHQCLLLPPRRLHVHVEEVLHRPRCLQAR